MKPGLSAGWWAALAFVAVTSIAGAAHADDNTVLFERASTSLTAGDTNSAIRDLETLADRGFLHPDVSYNRGLAYALRARSGSGQPGDLGRAAAGFEEALALRPSDRDAAAALDRVHAEVARRRSRQDKSDTIVRPSLDRVLLRLVAPATWAALALFASVTFGVGMILRRRPGGPVHVAGSVLFWLSLVALLGLVPLAFGSGWLEQNRGAAVVVAPAVTLRDKHGKPTDAPEVPEAALLELGEAKDGEILVRWGSYEGWVERGSVRPLAQ